MFPNQPLSVLFFSPSYACWVGPKLGFVSACCVAFHCMKIRIDRLPDKGKLLVLWRCRVTTLLQTCLSGGGTSEDKWTDDHRSAQTGIQMDARRRAGNRSSDAPWTWHPPSSSRGHLKARRQVFLFFTPSLSPSPSQPLPLTLASVQTTTQIDGFVFSSLSLYSSAITSLPAAVWATSRNLGLMRPKRCVGRRPELPGQIETTLTLTINQVKKSRSGVCWHWKFKGGWLVFYIILKGFEPKKKSVLHGENSSLILFSSCILCERLTWHCWSVCFKLKLEVPALGFILAAAWTWNSLFQQQKTICKLKCGLFVTFCNSEQGFLGSFMVKSSRRCPPSIFCCES